MELRDIIARAMERTDVCHLRQTLKVVPDSESKILLCTLDLKTVE